MGNRKKEENKERRALGNCNVGKEYMYEGGVNPTKIFQ